VTESSRARYLVTGAYGCIGAWTVQQLVADGREVVTFDAGTDARRLRLLMDDEQVGSVAQVRGDISHLEAVERVIEEYAVTNVIHLAALQVPFCRQDPPLGARVNVLGTVNLFEAARRRAGQIRTIVYASSIAAHPPEHSDDRTLGDGDGDGDGLPTTLYGVYKRANEGTAHVYWVDHGLASIGLRPHTVFGVGRDQGLTSAPTFAALAAATGQAYHIPYGGRHQLQYASDVAAAFIRASEADFAGAAVYDLGGEVTSIGDVIAAIERAVPESRGALTYDPDVRLPFPSGSYDLGLEAVIGPQPQTPLDVAVQETVQRFRAAIQRGSLSTKLG
jgi:UDP-glucuronate 4-epimerase